MDIFAKIAEERIRQAMENGEFNHLQGAGKPLAFEDETWIPEDLRLVYRIMKNAGVLPPEIETRKEIITLKELMHSIDDDRQRLNKLRELNYKILKLNTMRKRPLNLDDFPAYEERIFEKYSGS
jgi:hypothetical protein